MAGTLTLATIRNLVRNALNEGGTAKISDTELNAVINDGYKDTCVKSLGYEYTITKTNIAAERFLSLRAESPRVVRVNYVEYKIGTYGGKGLVKINPLAVGYAALNGSAPQYWFQWGDMLVIEPTPDVATYDLNIYASCYPSTVLSADGDLPSALPPELHERLFWFALAFSALKLRRWSVVAAAYNKYIDDVQRFRAEFIAKIADARRSHEIPQAVTMEG